MVETVNKRTTLIISDMAKSRAFYEGILGMTAYYDNEIVVSGDGLPAGEPGSNTHLVILKCQDPKIGMIGLLEFLDPPLPKPEKQKERLGIGDIVFVMDVNEVDEIHAKMKDAGIRVHGQPHEWEVTGADGNIKRMKTLSAFDPDGYFLELNMQLPAA